MSISWDAASRILRTPVYAGGLPYWPGVAQGTVIMAIYPQFDGSANIFRPHYAFGVGSGGAGAGGMVSSPYQWYNFNNALDPSNPLQAFNGGGGDNFAPEFIPGEWTYMVYSWVRTGSAPAQRTVQLVQLPQSAPGAAVTAPKAANSGSWSTTTAATGAVFGGDTSASPSANGFGNVGNTLFGRVANITILNYALTDGNVVARFASEPIPNAVGVQNVLAHWPLKYDLRSVVGTTDELIWNGTTAPDPNDRPFGPDYTGGTPRNRDRGRRIP